MNTNMMRKIAALSFAISMCIAVPVWAEEVWYDPSAYVDVPSEGAYIVTSSDGTQYYYIDGEQVSADYFNDPANRVEIPEEGAYTLTSNGSVYYYIDGVQVDESYYNTYINDPTIWTELPAQGPCSYTFNGVQYYAYNGQYVSEAEYKDHLYRDAAAQNGYTFYESETAARQAVTNYLNGLNWPDTEQGIKLVFHADSANPLVDLLQGERGCSDTLKYAYLEPYRDASWVGDGYISMGFWMNPTESHYTGFTPERYYAADAKAEEIAEQFRDGTDLEKVTGVYHYLIDTIEYDDTLEHGDVYDALLDGNSVCMGYASAFQMIMEKLGVESYLCTGDDLDDGQGHAWNAVRIGDEIYYVDATFGDTSGLADTYLLFGTNLRSDMYDLGIPDHSYYESAGAQYAAYDKDGRIIIVDEIIDNLTGEETEEAVDTEISYDEW